MALIVIKYIGTIATKYHDKIFRIYRLGEIIAEFYDIEMGKKFLERLQNNEADYISSTD